MTNEQPFQHLITLFHIFNGMPELLAQKMLQFNCFNPEFLKKVSYNKFLDEYTKDPDLIMNKPYFTNLKDVHKFYDKFFMEFVEAEPKRLPPSTNPKTILQTQLRNAVELEKYELAAQIRNYMVMVGMMPENF